MATAELRDTEEIAREIAELINTSITTGRSGAIEGIQGIVLSLIEQERENVVEACREVVFSRINRSPIDWGSEKILRIAASALDSLLPENQARRQTAISDQNASRPA